jgi:hypothetical protein
VEVCGVFCILLNYHVLLNPLFKCLIQQNSPRAEIHKAFVSGQLTEFPVTQKIFYDLHESGSELPLGVLRTLNFRSDSETGNTMDSRTPKRIELLAKSQD